MIDPDDVLYVLWQDGTETYTITHHPLVVVSRDPVTHDLHCHTCHLNARAACEHIIAAMAKRHQQKGAA